MIPPLEEALFKQDVACALELAEAGQVDLGYHVLDHSLGEAEALREEWAGALVTRYRLALVLFCQGHGVHFPIPAAAQDLAPRAPAERSAELVTASVGLRSVCEGLRTRTAETRARAATVRQQARASREARQRMRMERPV